MVGFSRPPYYQGVGGQHQLTTVGAKRCNPPAVTADRIMVQGVITGLCSLIEVGRVLHTPSAHLGTWGCSWTTRVHSGTGESVMKVGTACQGQESQKYSWQSSQTGGGGERGALSPDP